MMDWFERNWVVSTGQYQSQNSGLQWKILTQQVSSFDQLQIIYFSVNLNCKVCWLQIKIDSLTKFNYKAADWISIEIVDS